MNAHGTPTRGELEAAAEIAAAVAGDYLAVRVLPDASIAAIGDLLYTRALYLSVDRYGYGRRLCFADRSLAWARFLELEAESDTPAGAVAQRP